MELDSTNDTVELERTDLNPFLRSLGFVERTLAKISGVCVTLMMFLTTLDVFLRFVFNSPIKGNYEFQEIMLVCVSFLGLSYVQSQRLHIVMDLLPEVLSKKTNWLYNFLET